MAIQVNEEGMSKKSKALIVLLVILVISGFGAAAYMYQQNQDIKNNPPTAQQSQTDRAAAVKAKVAKLISVPADETPTLATVTDKEKLKDQPFFKDAQNGDQILIFPQAKKAIIYRENENKLINVGPIAITSDKTVLAEPVTTEDTTQTE